MKKIDYDQYLQSEWWRKIRKEALDHADNHCMICASTEKLDVHHNTYERLGCEKLSDVIVLCRSCHELYHSKVDGERKQPDSILPAISNFFNSIHHFGQVKLVEFSAKEHRLTINVPHAIVMHKANASKNQLIKAINRSQGREIIRDIAFHVGKTT